jgi:hypothetical protein
MKIKRNMIRDILNALRSITTDGTLNMEITEQFRRSERPKYYNANLLSEIPRQSQSIAGRIRELSLQDDPNALSAFAETYGFYLHQDEGSGKTSLINRTTLTTYLLENKVVKVTHFQGDGFFKSPPYTATKGKSDSETVASFFLKQYQEYKAEENPHKARLSGYSMYEMERSYEVYLFESDDYYYVVLNRTLMVFKKDLERIGSDKIGKYHSSFDRWISSFKTVNRTSVSFFVLATIILSNSILQFNVVAPYIEFNDIAHQLGTEFRILNHVHRIYDDNDPLRAVSEAAPFEVIQSTLQEFNRSSNRIGWRDINQLDEALTRVGNHQIDITISDGTFTRTQTFYLRVER